MLDEGRLAAPYAPGPLGDEPDGGGAREGDDADAVVPPYTQSQEIFADWSDGIEEFAPVAPEPRVARW